MDAITCDLVRQLCQAQRQDCYRYATAQVSYLSIQKQEIRRRANTYRIPSLCALFPRRRPDLTLVVCIWLFHCCFSHPWIIMFCNKRNININRLCFQMTEKHCDAIKLFDSKGVNNHWPKRDNATLMRVITI